VERQLGYKMATYLHAIEVVPELTDKGGYWEERGYDCTRGSDATLPAGPPAGIPPGNRGGQP
jgi:DMSO/TMAO reductase YedYZ molybdopterin-dependent catalytic subunit